VTVGRGIEAGDMYKYYGTFQRQGCIEKRSRREDNDYLPMGALHLHMSISWTASTGGLPEQAMRKWKRAFELQFPYLGLCGESGAKTRGGEISSRFCEETCGSPKLCIEAAV
jgi:hypothetical protein